MDDRSLFSHSGYSLCIFCQVCCAGTCDTFHVMHCTAPCLQRRLLRFLRTQLGFVLMNKISPFLVCLGVLCAEAWVVAGNQETVLWNKNRVYLCGCQMFGVHTGLKWSTPCSRKSRLHTGLCQLWDEILLPYKSQASGIEFSAVSGVLFCLFLPVSLLENTQKPLGYYIQAGVRFLHG